MHASCQALHGRPSSQAAQSAEAEVVHRGRYIVRVDATETLRPYDRSLATAPELSSLSMESVLQIPVMDDTTATVGCAPHRARHPQAHTSCTCICRGGAPAV